MTPVVNSTNAPSNSLGSRARFIRRTRNAAREAINRSLEQGHVTDIGKGGVDVTVPKKDLHEPRLRHGAGGTDTHILPGNNHTSARHNAGDRLERPKRGRGGSGGREASDVGGGEDAFTYHLSEKEFLNILFEDLELPNLFHKSAQDFTETRREHAGFSNAGPVNRRHIMRSKMKKMEREIQMGKSTNQQLIALLGEERDILAQYGVLPETRNVVGIDEHQSSRLKIKLLTAEVATLKTLYLDRVTPSERMRIDDIEAEIVPLNQANLVTRKWREGDLKFRVDEDKPQPITKAAMFCKMDVSASMSEEDKTKAKIFFGLLHRFLKEKYQRLDVIFIRHTHVAEEVDENEFFYGRETGGTVVSSAHEKFMEIQKARYPITEWNLYDAHVSDGDSSSNDREPIVKLMDQIVPMLQGFFYIQVRPEKYAGQNTELWKTYEPLAEKYKDRFWMANIVERKDIPPVFRELFKKRQSTGQPLAAYSFT